MKIRKRFIVTAIIVIATVITVAFLVASYLFSHSTWYKYNDKWIIGKDIHVVEERYGSFDWVYVPHDKIKEAYYFIYNDMFSSTNKFYYIMICDENEVVVEVFEGGPKGG